MIDFLITFLGAFYSTYYWITFPRHLTLKEVRNVSTQNPYPYLARKRVG